MGNLRSFRFKGAAFLEPGWIWENERFGDPRKVVKLYWLIPCLFFSTLVLFKAQLFPLGFLMVARKDESLERMGKIPVENELALLKAPWGPKEHAICPSHGLGLQKTCCVFSSAAYQKRKRTEPHNSKTQPTK